MSICANCGEVLRCPSCGRTVAPEPPRSPAQPDAEALLRELVACKDLKERVKALGAETPEQGNLAEYAALHKEYLRRKPLAWAAARAFLRGGSGG